MSTTGSDDRLELVLRGSGLKAIPVQVQITMDGQVLETATVRLVLPDAKVWGGGDALPQDTSWANRGNQRRHLYVARLMSLLGVANDARRRNLRTLGSTSLFHTPSLRSACSQLGFRLRVAEVVRRLGLNPQESDEELLDSALYPERLTLSGRDVDRYEEFAEEVLSNIEQHLDAQSSGPAFVAHLAQEALVSRVRAAGRDESVRAGVLAPLADRAGAILEEAVVIRSLRQAGAKRGDLGARVDELLVEVVTALKATLTIDSQWLEETTGTIERVLASRSWTARLGLLSDIADEFRDRSPLMECLLREVDIAPSYFIGRESRELYRKVRALLSPVERRLFALLYFPDFPRVGARVPSLPFNGHSLIMLPFVDSMLRDPELVGLTIWVLGHKRKTVGGESLAAELHKLYRQYVAFYAWWVRVVREDDRERKRMARRKRGERRLGGAEPTVAEPVAPEHGDLLERIQKEFIAVIATARLPERTITIVSKYFGRGLSQANIAVQEGLRQQAVAKQIKNFVNKYLQPQVSAEGGNALALLREAGYLRRGRRPRTR